MVDHLRYDCHAQLLQPHLNDCNLPAIVILGKRVIGEPCEKDEKKHQEDSQLYMRIDAPHPPLCTTTVVRILDSINERLFLDFIEAYFQGIKTPDKP